MSKQTKMFIGFGVLAIAGYLIWKQQQKPSASFSGGVISDRQYSFSGGVLGDRQR
jgi:hypothetical protein